MQTLKPPQILIIVLAAAASVLIANQFFDVYQAICLGVVVAVFVYSLILTLEEKKPPHQ